MANLFAEQGDRDRRGDHRAGPGRGRRAPARARATWHGLRRLCDQHGAYLIMDEVICGFGRLGHMVRQRALRRATRPHHLRQGRHLGLRAAGRRDRRRRRSASRSRPTRRSCCATATRTRATPTACAGRPGRPRHHRARRARRPVASTSVTRLADGLRSLLADDARAPRCAGDVRRVGGRPPRGRRRRSRCATPCSSSASSPGPSAPTR